jgi:AraC-like DNA-binding protein
LRLHAQLCSFLAGPRTASLEFEERALALMQCVLNLRSGLRPRQARSSIARDRRKRAKPLTEIALALGFASPSHFSTCFKSEFGCSPRRAI